MAPVVVVRGSVVFLANPAKCEDVYVDSFVVDDIPVRGFVGELDEATGAYYLFTHLHFKLSFNGANVSGCESLCVAERLSVCQYSIDVSAWLWFVFNFVTAFLQIIDAKVTTDPSRRVEIVEGAKTSVTFSYSVQWVETGMCALLVEVEFFVCLMP